MTTTQPCTAMVTEMEGTGTPGVWHPHACGESVAELGPCLVDVLKTQWSGCYAPCGEPEDCPQHQGELGHEYVGLFVHVTLGPCEGGLETKVDSLGVEAIWHCGEEAGHESHGYGPGQHPCAPTVTERIGVGHDAEVMEVER